jgi:hypothetical protein
MTNLFDTHMFWAYGDPSLLERLCMNSFVQHDYRLKVWTYDQSIRVASKIEVMDAREILSESRLFTAGNGSFAPFSDFFRYTLLNERGGLWVDTDVVALKPMGLQDWSRPFLVTEHQHLDGISWFWNEKLKRRPRARVNNNIIFNPAPERGNLIDLAQIYAERFPKDKVRWDELGPSLFRGIAASYREHGFAIKPPEFANSIDYEDCPAAFFKPGKPNPKAAFLHLYNQCWAYAKIDKNAPFPKGSLIAQLADKYL